MKKKYIIAFLVILSYASYNNAVEYLSDKGYNTSSIIINRGAFSLFIAIIIGLLFKKQLIPRNIKLQMVRLIVNGFSTIFIVSSYYYLSASTVSLLLRLDIPILIFLSTLAGYVKSQMQFWLSFWTVLVIIFLALDAKFIAEDSNGFLLAFAGVISIASGFLLIKKSVETESPFVVSIIFSLSNILFGLILLLKGDQFSFIKHEHMIGIFVSSGSQVLNYCLVVPLYKYYDTERARIPFIIAAIVTMCLEMILENKIFGISQIGLTLLISGMLLTISLNPIIPKIKTSRFSKLFANIKQKLK